MGAEIEHALMDAIHRIRLIEDEVRKTDNYEACTFVTACKWAVQDVLEELWHAGQVGF